MNSKSAKLCFVGNMLGRNANYVTTQGQIVADLFAAESYDVTCVSSKINRPKRITEIIYTLIRKRKDLDVVLIDTYSGSSFIIADVTGFLCRTFKIPSIIILRGGDLPNFFKKHPRWVKRVLNRADVLVAPSEYLAEKIGNWGYKIPVITNIVDIDLYPYRERTIISPNLIWMRSFHPIYNPEMAVKVLAKLRETVPKATLTMAGSDKGLKSDVKELAKTLKVEDAVRFAGFLNLEEKIKEFSEADIYLNTNRVDNMPVSVVEARALGLPVIATNVGGLPYLIEHGENGLLVADEDVDAMVKSIKLLLDDSKLTKRISQNGRRLAERSAWKSVCLEWEELISKILESKNTNSGKQIYLEKNFASERSENLS